MKFSRIVGNILPNDIVECEEKLTRIFLELGLRSNISTIASKIGGDPYIFTMLFPVEHILTTSISTAGTDGKVYYWNPKLIKKLDYIGLRIVAMHEASHAIFMHPQRRAGRNPQIWNIAVDYIVNNWVMEDFASRKLNAEDLFRTHLGKFIKLQDCIELMKDPDYKVPGLEDVFSTKDKPQFDPNKELTEEEVKQLEEWESNRPSCFYADSNLIQGQKKPEIIYDLLMKSIPKCPVCGRLGAYKKKDQQDKNKQQKQSGKQSGKSKKSLQTQQQQQGQQGQQQSGQGSSNGCGCDNEKCSCPHCGGSSGDSFGIGGTLDDHIDSSETQEEMYKRMSEAALNANKMAGKVPEGIFDELGKLVSPQLSWKDFLRTKIYKARAGNTRNDWTRYKTRPLFAGILSPRRRGNRASFACLLDTSGSMSSSDISNVISQLQSMDDQGEGIIVPADAQIYWNDAVKISKCSKEELRKVKVVGRGGTRFLSFINEYEERLGKQDFIVIMTDGYLFEDLNSIKKPKCDLIWIIVNNNSFKSPIGRVFHID